MAAEPAPDDATANRQRLADHVKNRRLSLSLSVRAAAERAGMARNTWTSLEDSTRRTAETAYAGIERALAWETGSVRAILDGGEPTPAIAVHDVAVVVTRPKRNITSADIETDGTDDVLIRIMKSDLPDADKARIVRTLLDDQRRFAQQRADELIREVLARRS